MHYGTTKGEEKSLKFRRSIYAVRDIQAGEVLTRENIRVIRSGYGLEPKYYDIILGHRAGTDIKRGTALRWEHLKQPG